MRIGESLHGVVVLALLALVAGAGCATSSYQTAKMLPAGSGTVTGAVSSYAYHESGDSTSTEAIELMGGYAVTDDFELGGKFARFSEEDVQVYNLLVAPKFGLVPGEFAIVAPSGVIFASSDNDSVSTDGHSWLTMPGVVFSHALSPEFELDLAAKLILGFSDDFGDNDVAAGGNIGVRLAPAGMSWAVMPELGVVFDDDAQASNGDYGYIVQIGLAFTYNFVAGGVAVAPASAPAPAAAPGAAPP